MTTPGPSSGSFDDPAVEIRIADGSTSIDALHAAMQLLVPQLSSSSPPPSKETVIGIVQHPDTALFIAELDGRIVGTLTLATYRIPTGLKAWIEDVIVDESASRRGIGEALNRAALDEARRRGAKDVSLTSRASREAANRLYQRIGFEPRETNLYRYRLAE